MPPPRTRALAPLALVALALFALTASAAAAGPAPPRTIVVRALASGGWRALPIRGARVRVLAGGETIARGRLGSLGMATLRTRGRRPAGFRVVVAGGRIGKHRFRGHTSATVRRYAWPRTVHVDFVTTLADRYRRAHGGSAHRAARRTKRFLDLPSSYVLGLDGTGNAPFDGRRFLAAAGTGSRYGRFVSRLVGRMERRGAHRSFRHVNRRRHGSARASGVLPGPSELAKVALQIAGGRGIFEALESATGLGGIAKTVLGMAGLQKQPPSQLQQEMQKVLADLQQIQQSISVVQTTVDELREEGRQFHYESKVENAHAFFRAGYDGIDTLNSATLTAIQDGCATEAPQPGCESVAEMLTGPSGFVHTVFEKGLGSAAGLTEYAEQIGGDALKGAAPDYNGIIQAGSALVTDGGSQTFFSAAESARLRSLAAYWISSYAETAAVAASAWGLAGNDEAVLHENVEQATRFATGISAMVPEAVPQRAVVDMRTGQMWPTTNSATASTWITPEALARQWSFDTGSDEWVTEPAAGEAKQQVESLERLGGKGGELPFADWRVPKAAQINQLLESVTPKPGQMAGEAVLEQAGIEPSVFVTPWGEEGRVRGVFTGRTDATTLASQQACPKGNSNPACYWPVMVGTGSYWQDVWVANARQVGPVYSYVDGSFEAGYNEADYGAFGEFLYSGLKTEMSWNEGERWGGVPVLFYREIPQSACFYYPAPGNPATGSPGCPGS
ncbi:MAG: hypothetical protein U0R71_04245 [Solirubrobacterales bacterium]